MKFLLSLSLLMISLTACAAARAPSTPAVSPTAVPAKYDTRCRNLLSSGEHFLARARSEGFVVNDSGVLFDLHLEAGADEKAARQKLGELGTVTFIDTDLHRASIYLLDSEQLEALGRLSFVRRIAATHQPLTR